MSRYEGQFFSIMGDSISTFEGCVPEGYAVYYTYEAGSSTGVKSPEDTWWWQVIAYFGGKLLANNSWSGSLTCAMPECDAASYGCGDERTHGLGRDGVTPDHIIVYLGTNDRGWGRPLFSEDKRDLSVIENAYTLMLQKIKKNYPQAIIWCCTMPETKCIMNPDIFLPTDWGGIDVEVYANAIERFARENDCRIIHLYGSGEIYDTIDGIHPSAVGMAALAKTVIAEMEK